MDKDFYTLTQQVTALKAVLSSLRAMSTVRKAIRRRKSEIAKQAAVLFQNKGLGKNCRVV